MINSMKWELGEFFCIWQSCWVGCQYQLSGLGSVTHHLYAENQLLLSRRERWIFNNHGVIVTLIIRWLGPPYVDRGDPSPR